MPLIITQSYIKTLKGAPNSWSSSGLTGPGSSIGTGCAIGNLGDGRVMIRSDGGTRVLDPATLTWSSVSHPSTNFWATRGTGHPNGNFYTGMGLINGGPSHSYHFFRFNYLTNDWTQLATMPTVPGSSRFWEHAICYGGVDNNIYVFGGKTNGVATNIIYKYTINTNSWSNTGTTLPITMRRHDAVTLKDGRIFIAGSETGANAVIYNPDANTVTSVQNYPTANYRNGFLTLLDNGNPVAAAFGASLTESNTLYEYIITNNTWVQTTNLPTSLSWNTAGQAQGTSFLKMKDGRFLTTRGSSMYVSTGYA